MINKLNNKIRLLPILLSMFLSGCATMTPIMPHTDVTVDNTEQKGIVVLKVYSASTKIRFKKMNKDYNDPDHKYKHDYYITGYTKNLIFFDKSYDKCFYSLEPGIYYISSASHSDASFTYNTTLAGITPEGRIVYGAFEVKAGEVLYIGNINFNWNSKGSLVTVSGSLNKAKKELMDSNSKYKNLASKMKYGSFYPAGSLVHVDKNGKFYLEE